MTALIEVPAGLAGVAVADTAIGDVLGAEGFYHYRGVDATQLARTRTLEQVWSLLLDGDQDSVDGPDGFASRLHLDRRLPARLTPVLAAAARGAEGDALTLLRTGMSAAGDALALRPLWDGDEKSRRRDVVRVAALVPTVLAALHRLRNGQDPVPPRDDLGHVGHYLYVLHGEPAPRAHVDALSRYLISALDHGFNASTFTARVVASTGADAAAAMVAGIAALSGPLHGGAPSRVVQMLDEIGSLDRADQWLTGTLDRGERLMGFGHAVYRGRDPRSELLRETVLRLATSADDRGRALVELAVGVEHKALAALAERRPDRPLRTNVEFYAGVLMDVIGLPRELFSATFAVARCIGWSAHVLEQTRDRKIVRPAARYVGPQPAPAGTRPSSASQS
jgi:citrate synthase